MAPADLIYGLHIGKLYYFKSADDPPNYKGLIDMRECKAEDVDVEGLPRNAAKSKYDLDGGGGQVSLLIRISHKVGRSATLRHRLRMTIQCEHYSAQLSSAKCQVRRPFKPRCDM